MMIASISWFHKSEPDHETWVDGVYHRLNHLEEVHKLPDEASRLYPGLCSWAYSRLAM